MTRLDSYVLQRNPHTTMALHISPYIDYNRFSYLSLSIKSIHTLTEETTCGLTCINYSLISLHS